MANTGYDSMFEQNKNLITKEINDNFDRFIDDVLNKRMKEIENRIQMSLATKADYKEVINLLIDKADKKDCSLLVKSFNEFKQDFKEYSSQFSVKYFEDCVEKKMYEDLSKKVDITNFQILENKLKNYVVFTKPNTEVQ